MNTVDSLELKNKRVLVRVDFNVPLSDGKITDDTRMVAAVDTIQKIRQKGGKVILMSHMGRPKGQVNKEFSLQQIVNHLSDLLNVKVLFSEDCVGSNAVEMANSLNEGDVLLLENLRFHAEEEAGDETFAKSLAELGDVYINDAFGTAHRAHASTAIIAKFFANQKGFGYIMANEIENVSKVLNSSETPVTAIVGGAKVSSKISILENLLPKVDQLIIGGGMAYTFLKAQGASTGDSMVEEDKLDLALELIKKAEENNVKFIFPVDSLNGESFSPDTPTHLSDAMSVPDGQMGLDIGPKTIELFKEAIMASKTILWNGPVGVFEFEAFSKGTIAVGQAIVDATANGSFSLVGGGDSVAAAKKYDFAPKLSYVSTGGGAMLEYLEGKTLPGIQAILD